MGLRCSGAASTVVNMTTVVFEYSVLRAGFVGGFSCGHIDYN